jgi:hypothetical protein
MKTALITLPLYLLSNFVNYNSWNIVRIAFGRNTKNHETVLKVFYPKGSYSPSKNPIGGIGFFASPKEIFMANEVLFKYQVFFDKTFNPVFGGKLPGLFIGKGTNKKDMVGASGGKHYETSSCRIAWRENLTAEAYIYVPPQQHSNYYKIPNLVENKKFGDSLWRGSFSFYKNTWNNISIRLKTNTFINNLDKPKPNYDGELEITINNITQSFNQLLWRTQPEYNINSIIFETFFGGSDAKTATPSDTWTYFKNIQIQRYF